MPPEDAKDDQDEAPISTGCPSGMICKMHYSIDDIAKAFKRISPDSVVAVYVHGSFLTKTWRRDSDIDMAVLFAAEEQPEEYYMTEEYIEKELCKLTGFRKFDVRSCNNASLEAKAMILQKGKCVFNGDHEARVEFETAVQDYYLDFKPYRDEQRAAFLSALQKGKI